MILKKNAKKAEIESFLGSILDPPDLEAIVLRGKDCDVVYANAKAGARMGFSLAAERKCKSSYAKSLPGLCANCLLAAKIDKEASSEPFEIVDKDGNVFSAKCSTLNSLSSFSSKIFVFRCKYSHNARPRSIELQIGHTASFRFLLGRLLDGTWRNLPILLQTGQYRKL